MLLAASATSLIVCHTCEPIDPVSQSSQEDTTHMMAWRECGPGPGSRQTALLLAWLASFFLGWVGASFLWVVFVMVLALFLLLPQVLLFQAASWWQLTKQAERAARRLAWQASQRKVRPAVNSTLCRLSPSMLVTGSVALLVVS